MRTDADRAVAEKIRTFVRKHAESMDPQNIDGAFMRQAVVSSVTCESEESNAKLIWTLAIPTLYRNNPIVKSIHGGATATMFDNGTSMAILACKNGWEDTGVTRNLNVTYFRPPFEGEQITIECEVLQLTKRLATIRGVMKRASDGTVLAICQHDKYRQSHPAPGKAKL